MNDRLQKSIVQNDASLADAMRSLDESLTQIVLVVDDVGKLIGTLTDGDIRRALLAGQTLESEVGPYMSRQFFSVEPTAGRAEVVELMQARRISQVPVVDETGAVVALHTLREMLSVAERPNWAILMAGGRGRRLGAITDEVPKPMLPVAGRPILERIVLHLVGHGIRRVFLSVNYKSEMIEDHFGNGHRLGCTIEYLRETKALDTGGSLSLLEDTPSEPLLVMNGDLVTQANVGALIDYHERGGHAVTMAVREYHHRIPYGCVQVRGNTLVGFDEKPVSSHLINAGIYVLSPDVLTLLRAEETLSLPGLVQRVLDSGGEVRVQQTDEEWIDVGHREQLDRARGKQ